MAVLLMAVVALHVAYADITSFEQVAERNRFVGEWVANLTRSNLDPKYPFKGATLRITVSSNTVTIASELVDPSGNTQRGTETLRTDGSETKGSLTPGVTHFASWVGPDVLALTARKDGQLFGLVTYELSAGGKTMTARSSGMLEQVVVFERQ